jgi:predicted heme/steroid binding protein
VNKASAREDDVAMRDYTMDELAKANGKDETPTLVAVNGKVYDVSKSALWKDGFHQDLHNSGRDLTSALDDAPHDESVLERYPLVGTLKKD